MKDKLCAFSLGKGKKPCLREKKRKVPNMGSGDKPQRNEEQLLKGTIN